LSRTAFYTALVLRSRPSGESNSEVTLLTDEEGIIKATVFGGAKSKLRAHCAPFNSGRIWIYRDKSKEYGKVCDFDVHSWRPGLRELYERTVTASAIADTIISSHGGGGDWAAVFKLTADTLDALENANDEFCERLLVYFLWQWSDFLGIQPQLGNCSSCGMETNDAPFWFNMREGAVFCSACLQAVFPQDFQSENTNTQLQRLNPSCRKWLSAVGVLDPGSLHRYSMDSKSFHEVKSLTTGILAGVFGKRLSSWGMV